MNPVSYTFLFITLLVTLLFPPVADAAAIPLTPPPSVVPSGGGFTTGPAANMPSISGGAYPAGMTANVSGRAVTVPATARFAANAGRFAAGAARLNPWLAGAATLAWLLPYGIELIGDQWMVKNPPIPGYPEGSGFYYNNIQDTLSPTPQGACDKLGQMWWNSQPSFHANWTYETTIDGSNRCTMRLKSKSSGSYQTIYSNLEPQIKQNAYPPSYRPAGNPDWDGVGADDGNPNTPPLPDDVANEHIGKGGNLPIEVSPHPDVITEPMGDPYVDPSTGKNYRDVIYIKPNPANPNTVEMTVGKQEVDANGQPAQDPQTGEDKPPEEQPDHCKNNPDTLGCLRVGTVPPNPELTNIEKTISINPQGGWGATTAACPSDLTTTFLGKPVSWSFKLVCDGATMFRPVVIAMAWITSILIALGIYRRND